MNAIHTDASAIPPHLNIPYTFEISNISEKLPGEHCAVLRVFFLSIFIFRDEAEYYPTFLPRNLPEFAHHSL